MSLLKTTFSFFLFFLLCSREGLMWGLHSEQQGRHKARGLGWVCCTCPWDSAPLTRLGWFMRPIIVCVCVCRLCECCLSESVCHMNIQCRSREKIQWFPFRVEVLITSMTSEPRLPLRGESIWVFLEPESIFRTLSWQNSSKLKSVIGIWAHFYLMCWNPFHILKERQMCLRKLFLNIVFKLNWRHFQHHLLKYSTPPTLIVLMLPMFLHINEYYLLLIDLIFEISQFIFQNIWYLTDKQWSVIGDD